MSSHTLQYQSPHRKPGSVSNGRRGEEELLFGVGEVSRLGGQECDLAQAKKLLYCVRSGGREKWDEAESIKEQEGVAETEMSVRSYY